MKKTLLSIIVIVLWANLLFAQESYFKGLKIRRSSAGQKGMIPQ